MTGRAAATAALYCGFLALWALAGAARRREPIPYLLLGAALLEAALLVGAVIGITELDQAGSPPAPLAFTLSAASAAIYLLAAVALRRDGRRWWTVGTAACTVELLGVLAIGTWSLLDPARFPAATVWSGFGSGYGCFPLALPLLGLVYQRSRRPSLGAWQTRTSPST